MTYQGYYFLIYVLVRDANGYRWQLTTYKHRDVLGPDDSVTAASQNTTPPATGWACLQQWLPRSAEHPNGQLVFQAVAYRGKIVWNA